jgi:hypothetical protein
VKHHHVCSKIVVQVEKSEKNLRAQEAACRLSKPDEVSGKIGALNTLVRNADGSMNGYNTDWEAAISSIEDALSKLSSYWKYHCLAPPDVWEAW